MHVYASRCTFGARFGRSTALLCHEGIISESRMPPLRENCAVILAIMAEKTRTVSLSQWETSQ